MAGQDRNNLELSSLLPLHALAVTLRFTGDAQFGLLHQASVHAFIRHLLGSPPRFDTLLSLDAPESGRSHYRPGELYRFAVYAINGGETLLLNLIDRLRKLPAGAPLREARLPLRDNLQLEALHDIFTDRPVSGPQDLTPYDYNQLQSETRAWKGAPQFSLRWLSPVRLLKAKTDPSRGKGESRFCRESADLDIDLLLTRLWDSFAHLVSGTGQPRPLRADISDIPSQAADLFWVAGEYRNRDGKAKPLSGMAGEILLGAAADYAPTQLCQLVLGQYLGVGQMRAFGLGRYVLEGEDCAQTVPLVKSTNSLLQRVIEEDNLYSAYEAIRDNNKKAQSAQDSVQEEWWLARQNLPTPEEERLADDMERLQKRLLAGPPPVPVPLRGVVLPEADGDLRALAIPPFWERVAQRAVAQQLTPLLESVMSPHSYGYRRGQSRVNASMDIQRAWRAGYRWVYEADIEDFFDNVDWQRLERRLRTLLRDDPVTDELLSWVAAPVDYQGSLIQRHQGLPQGAAVSPMLANLFLDDLDRDLESAGFRLVRFADDFVVLCKSREQAEAAARRVRSSLTDMGLELNADKSRMVPFEQGFRYLGYLFMNDLVVDLSSQRASPAPAGPTRPPPSNSWLARLGSRSPVMLNQPLKAISAGDSSTAPTLKEEQKPLRLGQRDDHGTLLMLTGKSSLVSTRAGRLIVERDEQPIQEVPWGGLSAVLLLGNHHITTPAIREAMRQNVPIHLAGSGGLYQGTLWSGTAGNEGSSLWLQQLACCSDPRMALPVARQLVSARIRHMRELLRQRRPLERQKLDSLRDAAQRAGQADGLNHLNGVEGSATRLYFEALTNFLPKEYGFTGRNRRPPRDPFNALLSLGYTLLYSHTETLLRADGLYPWVGCYHQPRGRHAALASDMMEPFRHLVERTALRAVTLGQLKPNDFTQHPQHGCRLAPGALRQYLAMLSQRFETPLTAAGETVPRKPLEHLHRQNRRFIAWLRDDSDFRAWINR